MGCVENVYKDQKYELMTYKNLIDQSLSFVIKKGKFVVNKSIRVRVLSKTMKNNKFVVIFIGCLLYTSPSPRD